MDVMGDEAAAVARSHGIDVDAVRAAPFVARDYYGGQGSAMYSLVSTGTVVSGLAWEAAQAAVLADEAGEVWEAEVLRAVATLADVIGG